MKFTFYLNEFDIPDVKSEVLFDPVAWVLTDNGYVEACERILLQIAEARSTGVEWEMAYNKSVLNLKNSLATCIDLYEESRTCEVSLSQFEKLIKLWKQYLQSTQKPMEVELNSNQ